MPINKQMMFLGIIGLLCLAIIDIPSVSASTYFSPIKQLKHGHYLENITCNANQHIILKKASFQPACVTQETATKLIERGWGITIESFNSSVNHLLTLTTDKESYKINEQVQITIKNISNVILWFPDTSFGLNISDPDGKSICCGGYLMLMQLQPNMSKTLNLNHMIGSSPMKVGNYTISISYILITPAKGAVVSTTIQIK